MQELYLTRGLIKLNIYLKIMEEKFLTPAQIAKILNVSEQTVWNWCKKAKLPAIKIPGSRKWLISNVDLEKFQKELKKKQYGYK